MPRTSSSRAQQQPGPAHPALGHPRVGGGPKQTQSPARAFLAAAQKYKSEGKPPNPTHDKRRPTAVSSLPLPTHASPEPRAGVHRAARTHEDSLRGATGCSPPRLPAASRVSRPLPPLRGRQQATKARQGSGAALPGSGAGAAAARGCTAAVPLRPRLLLSRRRTSQRTANNSTDAPSSSQASAAHSASWCGHNIGAAAVAPQAPQARAARKRPR